MTQVALSLGSNIERDTHIRFALEALHELFGELEIYSLMGCSMHFAI